MKNAELDKKAKSMDLSKYEKATISKERMYKFEYKDLSYEKQKQKRNSLRRRLNGYMNDLIILFVQNSKNGIKNQDEIKKLISEFQIHYKETYVSNDLSIGSVYRGSNADRINDLTMFFEIIKEQVSKK